MAPPVTAHDVHTAAVVRDYISQPRISWFNLFCIVDEYQM